MWSGYNNPNVKSNRIIMPNGADWYILDKATPLKQPSLIPLSFPMLDTEDDQNKLVNAINVELTSPGSTERPVNKLIYSKGQLVPVTKRGYPIAVRPDSRRWGAFMDRHFTAPNRLNQSFFQPGVTLPRVNITPFTLGEPQSTSIVKEAESSIEAEYYAKAGFIEACVNNQWLMPYAHRLGWRYDDGIAIITVPYWSNNDLSAWDDITYTGPSKQGFYMSDGRKYPYPPDIALSNSNIISGDMAVVDGVTFDVNEVLNLSYPQTNRKQQSVAKVAKEIREGLLPFDPPYPVVQLKDGKHRIAGKIVDGSAVIYIVPNNTIIGYHNGTMLTRALKFYQRMWNEGELLNDYGHYFYEDTGEFVEKDGLPYVREEGINFPHLTDKDL